MIKRILVPLDSSPFTEATLNYACFLARQNNATLTGLAVLDVPGIEKSVGTLPVGGIYYADKLVEAKKHDELDHIADLVANFKAVCGREGVSHRVSQFQGSPSTEIIKESLYYDRVVMGMRTNFRCDAKPIDPGDAVENLLDDTITPFVVVPRELPDFPTAGKPWKVLVAFNSSLPSARAMHRFAQMADQQLYQVKIFRCGGEESESRASLLRAANFLRDHGFEKRETCWMEEGKLSDEADKLVDWADKVVVGVHSRAGLVDFMIGSFSRKLLHRADRMLLLG